MTDQPPSDRFKTAMPQPPGVSPALPLSSKGNPVAKLVIGILAALLLVFLGVRWGLRPRLVQPNAAGQPQIELPSPAPDPSTLLPHASDASPAIADVGEMAKPWSSRQFFIGNKRTGENIPALLIRLPIASASQSSGYWAFSLNAPEGDCKLEYITDLRKLRNDYGFRVARHPMVGNPCSRTVFDPLKMSNLPGNVFIRGGIVQGSDLRPPLEIEIEIQGKEILAIRSE